MAGQISAIQPQKRDPTRVSVYIDGDFAFGLHQDDARHLAVGQTLSDEQIQAWQAQDATSRAYHQTLRWLGRRPRSIAEVRRYLEKKDLASSAIEHIIARLEDLHYVDDAEFARYWVRQREDFKPRGQRALRYELRQKGIDNRHIDAALAELSPEDSARRAAQKKLRTLRHQDPDTLRQKLGAFLVRRGFDYEVVRKVVDDLSAELAEPDDETFGDEQ